ncbi:LacI family DNA-binding transcriptional regulator [Caenimonas sp. SL110]|uniref:LacI family DNA-binding transcriptional regulator n=1 Tax=Caenimonas sp. SL110 TaxID=1450524 RepID=UPI0006539C5C|nr:LacI family DNA-binding transcriptional regulator [Caenimonas sp. SL110]
MDKPRRRAKRDGVQSVRIEEVAREAGVAPMTVSRAINKPETVSEKTRKAVMEAIAKVGYIPNHVAGGLASRRSRTVGLVIPHIRNSTFADRVQGMTDVLHRAGYNLLLGLSGYSEEAEFEQVTAFLGQRVAGLSLTGTSHAAQTRALLMRAGIPVVETSTLVGPFIDMAVGYSNEQAARAMAEYLVSCGYRKVAMINAQQRHDRTLARERGFLDGMRASGVAVGPEAVFRSETSLALGAKAFVDVISTVPDVEAIFCANDVLAVGGMLEARRRGIRVPEDIGFAGFDDIELAQEFTPALTTIRLKRYEVGSVSASMLLDRIQGGSPETPVVDLGYEIVPRSSTRRPTGKDPLGAN